MTGSILLAPLTNPTFDLVVSFDDCRAADRRDTEGNVSGIVRLTGPFDQPFIQGLGPAEGLRVQSGVLYLRSIEQQTQAANAMLRWLYADEGSTEALRFELEQQRWQALSDATAEASEIQPDAEFGPQRDPTFPSRYFASAARESHRLNALQVERLC